MCADSLTVIDISAKILTIGIDSLFHACLFDCDAKRVVANAWDAGSCTSAVIRAVVIMADGDNHPVALSDAFAHIRPQTVIERAAAGTPESLVLDCYTVLVKEGMSIEAPPPLSVVTIAESAVTHS